MFYLTIEDFLFKRNSSLLKILNMNLNTYDTLFEVFIELIKIY